MGAVWTIAEQRRGELKTVSFELLAVGRKLADALGCGLVSIVIGNGVDEGSLCELIERGADEVFFIMDPSLAEFICETYTGILERLVEEHKPTVVLAAATTSGRTLMPYLAIKLRTGLTADCTELSIEPGTDNLLQTRPAIGGNIMATIKTSDHRPQLATVRPRSSKPLDRSPEHRGRLVEIPFANDLLDARVEVLGYRENQAGFANLEEADIVIAGGRGLKKGENFALIRELAEAIGGQVGASRDAVDRGWIGYPHQIGLSGKTISPRLYLGAGISGSIQHLAGIKTSEIIVSVNIDPDATLHKVADFAVVGDLFEVVPELVRQLKGEAAAARMPESKEARTPVASEHSVLGSHSPRCGYNPVTPEIVAELQGLLGTKNVILGEEQRESYSHDETDASLFGHLPEVVLTPETVEQVSAVVKLANRERIPITPRGAGSGLSGGAIPSFGGIVLSVEKMSSLIELDEEDMLAVAEAGMVTNDLAMKVQERGLFFAGYPMSLETCFLGGNIAENAGGGKAVKYGVTGRYIQGLELVTPTGEIVWLGGKTVKDVSGYDLTHLVVGSEGTLGIVTKAIVKLIGFPTSSSILLALFKTPRDAIRAVPLIMVNGIVPTSIEFMDKRSFETSCRYLNESLAFEHAGAMLLIEVDGRREEQVQAELVAIGELCEKQGASEVYVAEDANTKERIWSIRRNIAEAFKVYSPVQSLEDIVVPTSKIPEIVDELEILSRKYGLQIPCYGHAGDGNLHATLVKDPEMGPAVWREREDACLREIYQITKRLGGKISGEHGIGIKRKGYFTEITNETELGLMRAIKRAWDPNNIMNPGKIFDLEDAGDA